MSKRNYVEGPAVLLGIVVAVTAAMVALTYDIGRHIIEHSRMFVVNSPPVQQGLSATHAGESRASAGPQGPRPEMPGQALPVETSAQGVDGVVARVVVAAHGKTGIDIASRVSQQSTLVSTTAAEVSPAAAGQGDRGPGPAGHDAEPGVQDSVPSVTSVALKNRPAVAPDTVSSDGRIQVAEPARTAESARPAVNAVMRDGFGPAAPASFDSRQPLSGGQAVVSAVSVNERIARLLEQAGKALREDRLMIPAHRNAYSYYKQVLSQEPGNAEAHEGMKKIVERYVTLARHAIQRGDNLQANQYITRALRVRPGDRRLLAMKQRINTMLASTSSEPAATPLKPPPQERETPRNIFQRLRDFFMLHVPLN
jgi:hypothetical protein